MVEMWGKLGGIYIYIHTHTHIYTHTHTKTHLHIVVLSHVLLFYDTMDCIAQQAPLSMAFPRQEYWSGLPCPSLGELPNPGIDPVLPETHSSILAWGILWTEEPGRL